MLVMIYDGFVLFGLLADIIGFSLIGFDLLSASEHRKFWGISTLRGRVGFLLVILGFGLQAVGQVGLMLLE